MTCGSSKRLRTGKRLEFRLASLERALQQQRRKLGAHFASMRFYSENIEQEGTVVVGTNGTTDEILFQALEQTVAHSGKILDSSD